MRTGWVDNGDLPPSSMRSQLDLLIGDKRKPIGAVAVLSIIAGFAEAGMIAIIAQVAAALVNSKNAGQGGRGGILHVHASTSTLLWIGFGLAMLRLVLQWPLSVLPSQIASQVQSGLRTRVFRAFSRASWDVQSRDREGALQELMTGQSAQATAGAMQSTGVLTSSLNFIILMGTAVAISPLAAGIVFTVAAAMFAVLRPLRALGVRRSRSLSQAQVKYAGGIAEANRLAEETHVFGVSEAQFQRMVSRIDRVRLFFYRTQIIGRLVPNIYQSLVYLVLIVALAGIFTSGTHHASSLGAIVLLLFRAAQNGQAIQTSYQALQQSLPFIDRLQLARVRYESSALIDGQQPLEGVRTLAFENVCFSYNPGRPVLTDVSFAVEAGEAIGIVGPSGAGKSTLVQILLQLRVPGDGRYLVNGEDVRCYVRAQWHRLVAYVPQEPRLLHDTVSANIRFFRDLDDESVERAARLARIHDEIMSWSDGYDTVVGPRADAVSGGQQQRICLARALVARPHVLVLDEPTSALDPHSETLIQESLTALKSELTLFTVAHRMSTLDMCDRVMVILDGQLAAFDTKATLRQENPYYRSAAMIAAGTVEGTLPG
jgi:ABC-type multidrug transport system fused ATPase/permease subunit